MLILAMESSGKAASAALIDGQSLLAQSYQRSGLTHSRTLLPMVLDLLKNSEHTLEEVDALAVANGPGSFTGVRIGVSAAKGLAWALEKPVTGVSTLEALAWHGQGMPEVLVCPVLDARRGQVYNALFAFQGGKPVRLCPDRAISLEELYTEIKSVQKSIFLVGDGAEICYTYFSERDTAACLAPENLRYQSAWGVAMAAMDKEPGTANGLLPVYLRLSQAERERQARLRQG